MTTETHNPIPRLTKDQAALIGLFTGINCGKFGDIQLLADKYLGRPTWTHEYANPELWDKLKALCKDDFLAICHDNNAAVNSYRPDAQPNPSHPALAAERDGFADRLRQAHVREDAYKTERDTLAAEVGNLRIENARLHGGYESIATDARKRLAEVEAERDDYAASYASATIKKNDAEIAMIDMSKKCDRLQADNDALRAAGGAALIAHRSGNFANVESILTAALGKE